MKVKIGYPPPKIEEMLARDPFAERPRFGNDAVIDEVRVYDRKLSADEIKQVKSHGLK